MINEKVLYNSIYILQKSFLANAITFKVPNTISKDDITDMLNIKFIGGAVRQNEDAFCSVYVDGIMIHFVH